MTAILSGLLARLWSVLSQKPCPPSYLMRWWVICYGAPMLYRAFDVWKRTQNGVVRYRCFESIPSGLFSVQSADFFGTDASRKKVEFLESQFVELLFQQAPDERSGAFGSVEEALQAHDHDFENT